MEGAANFSGVFEIASTGTMLLGETVEPKLATILSSARQFRYVTSARFTTQGQGHPYDTERARGVQFVSFISFYITDPYRPRLAVNANARLSIYVTRMLNAYFCLCSL